MKKKLIMMLCVVVLTIGLYWIWSYSYIEVRLQPEAVNSATVQILDQSKNKSVEISGKEGKFKKLVKRGQHEILARQGDHSYFSVARAGGWLGTLSVDAVLAPEKHRQFIGDNPGPCGAFVRQVLMTFGCGDTFRNTVLHMPATAKQATYALKPSKAIDGVIEGVAQTSEGTVVVLKRLSSIDRDTSSAHTAYLLNEKSELTGGIALKGLEEDKTYTVLKYKQGFLLYSDGFKKILNFSTRDSSPAEINNEAPANMSSYALSVDGDAIVIVYSETDKDVDLDDPKAAKKIKSAATIVDGQQTRNIPLDKRYTSLLACGQNKLCGLLNKQMEVLDITKNNPKLLYTVVGVDQMDLINNRMVVVRGKEILVVDTEKRAGSIEYSLGGYFSCGLLPTAPEGSNGYTLCLINGVGKKVALQIDPAKSNQGSIDKKIAELIKMPEVKNLTTYGQFISITPNAGKTEYNPRTSEFSYSPEKIKTASNAIDQAIDRIGIDRSKYQITNILSRN